MVNADNRDLILSLKLREVRRSLRMQFIMFVEVGNWLFMEFIVKLHEYLGHLLKIVEMKLQFLDRFLRLSNSLMIFEDVKDADFSSRVS